MPKRKPASDHIAAAINEVRRLPATMNGLDLSPFGRRLVAHLTHALNDARAVERLAVPDPEYVPPVDPTIVSDGAENDGAI